MCKSLRQRLRPQAPQNGVRVRRQIETAEFAGIMKAQLLAVIQIQQNMFMLFTGLFGAHQMQPAGHAQMHQQMAVVVEIENNEFSATANGVNRPAPDLITKRFCRRFRDCAGPENPGRLYGPAFKPGCSEVINNGLYFRKFGHVGSGSGFKGSRLRSIELRRGKQPETRHQRSNP